ncbi:MAG: hypothetical protein V8R07_13810 [Bacteroides fragilis]
MTGLSFIIGDESLIRTSRDYPKRSYYCNLYLQYDYFEKTGEMQLTPPVQTVYTARQALDEYFAVGEEAKFTRHKRVFEAIHKGLQELGLGMRSNVNGSRVLLFLYCILMIPSGILIRFMITAMNVALRSTRVRFPQRIHSGFVRWERLMWRILRGSLR